MAEAPGTNHQTIAHPVMLPRTLTLVDHSAMHAREIALSNTSDCFSHEYRLYRERYRRWAK
jgi:hypothetical protein